MHLPPPPGSHSPKDERAPPVLHSGNLGSDPGSLHPYGGICYHAPGLAPAHEGALTLGSLRPTMGSPTAQRAAALPPRAKPLARPSQGWTASSGHPSSPPRDPRSLAARQGGYLTPRGFRDLPGDSPLSPSQTHTLPPSAAPAGTSVRIPGTQPSRFRK